MAITQHHHCSQSIQSVVHVLEEKATLHVQLMTCHTQYDIVLATCGMLSMLTGRYLG